MQFSLEFTVFKGSLKFSKKFASAFADTKTLWKKVYFLPNESLIRFRIFQGLFTVQLSRFQHLLVLLGAAQVASATYSPFSWLVVVFATARLIYQIFFALSTTFFNKFRFILCRRPQINVHNSTRIFSNFVCRISDSLFILPPTFQKVNTKIIKIKKKVFKAKMRVSQKS